MQKIMERIKSSYKPGSGDDGHSNMSKKGIVQKVTPISHLYMASEEALLIIGQIVHHHETSYDKIKLLPKAFHSPACRIFKLGHIQTNELIQVITWLEQGLYSLQSFCYCEGDSERHYWPETLYSFLNDTIKKWKDDSASKEFQSFSTHKNLMILNTLRVKIRALELVYRQWVNSLEKEDLTEAALKGLKFHGKVLNRLSTFLWSGMQIERKALGIEPKYWVSAAPDF